MKYYLITVLTAVILLFMSCSDSPEKVLGALSKVRIEPSDCQNCTRCTTEFSCPREAISVKNDKAVINTESCVSCKLCINDFKCPYGAIIDYADVIRPSVPADLYIADSNSVSLTLSFGESGDDLNKGRASYYRLQMSRYANFQPDTVIYEGKDGNQWLDIFNLISDTDYYFRVTASDEAGNISDPAEIKGRTLPAAKGALQ